MSTSAEQAKPTSSRPSFLQRVLRPPSYGLTTPDGALVVPSTAQMWREFFARHNVLADKRNWIHWVFALATLGATSALVAHWLFFATPAWVAFGAAYAVAATSHTTFYLHRYGAHRAFAFRNAFWLFVCKNLTVKLTTEEIYVVSHIVHHKLADQPGDPHNPAAGYLHCALSISNHHAIAWDLDAADYERLTKLVSHTGIRVNSYAQYQTWGTLCHPAHTVAAFAFNWGFWGLVCWSIGGWALVSAVFGYTALYAWGIRNFNYFGHGAGHDRRRDGSDFNRADLSRNHWWPGFVGGEWHNNHHLFPNSARSGFHWWQVDFPWMLAWGLYQVGVIVRLNDDRQRYFEEHYRPWQRETVGS